MRENPTHRDLLAMARTSDSDILAASDKPAAWKRIGSRTLEVKGLIIDELFDISCLWDLSRAAMKEWADLTVCAAVRRRYDCIEEAYLELLTARTAVKPQPNLSYVLRKVSEDTDDRDVLMRVASTFRQWLPRSSYPISQPIDEVAAWRNCREKFKRSFRLVFLDLGQSAAEHVPHCFVKEGDSFLDPPAFSVAMIRSRSAEPEPRDKVIVRNGRKVQVTLTTFMVLQLIVMQATKAARMNLLWIAELCLEQDELVSEDLYARVAASEARAILAFQMIPDYPSEGKTTRMMTEMGPDPLLFWGEHAEREVLGINQQDGEAIIEGMTQLVHQVNLGTRLFRTLDGWLGTAKREIKSGDVLCVLFGAETPFVLRPCMGGTYTLVSEAYVPGLMDGQALKMELEEVAIHLV